MLRPARGFAQTAGVTEAEIRVGTSGPYSGPAAEAGAAHAAQQACFDSINDAGGINGRRIQFIRRDDGGKPDRAVTNIEELVQQDDVALIFGMVGTSSTRAAMPKLNEWGVPQLFVDSRWDRLAQLPQHPWTIGWPPSDRIEAQVLAKHVLQTRPHDKIGVVFPADISGRSFIAGLADVAGPAAAAAIKAIAYDAALQQIDASKLGPLRDAGCGTVFIAGTARPVGVAKLAGWTPVRFITSMLGVPPPLGPELANWPGDTISTAYLKSPTDPAWDGDAGMQEFRSCMKRYLPTAAPANPHHVRGYAMGLTLVEVLKRCGNDLSRPNIMKRATELTAFSIPVLLRDIKLTTTGPDVRPVRELQLYRSAGGAWTPLDGVISGNAPFETGNDCECDDPPCKDLPWWCQKAAPQ
jgi:branched-chain amino acid transport system substrate-binding protein